MSTKASTPSLHVASNNNKTAPTTSSSATLTAAATTTANVATNNNNNTINPVNSLVKIKKEIPSDEIKVSGG